MMRDLFINDRPVLVAIALNTVVLFLLSFDELAHHRVLYYLDYGFTTYFVIEAGVKIRACGFRNYIALGWNRFDFFVVLLSLPSYMVMFTDLPDLSFLLLLRIARIFKFFRFLRFVPDMPRLLRDAVRAIRASAMVALGFFLFNFMLALVACHLFRDVAPDYFGNPLLAFYSIFKVFTIEGWYEIPDAIAAATSWEVALFTRLFFMVLVVGGGVLGLSLINAIFVDEILRDDNNLVERRLDVIEAKLDQLLAARAAERPPAPPPPEA
jgi:voltage-gated sodium channel